MMEECTLKIQYERGDLPFKTEWQSLDGRLCAQYHGSLQEALRHHAHLIYCGAKPKVWADALSKVKQAEPTAPPEEA